MLTVSSRAANLLLLAGRNHQALARSIPHSTAKRHEERFGESGELFEVFEGVARVN